MGSFYGGSNIIITDVIKNKKIEKDIQELKNHIIISTTEPTVQKEGDLWFVIVSDNNNNNNNG